MVSLKKDPEVRTHSRRHQFPSFALKRIEQGRATEVLGVTVWLGPTPVVRENDHVGASLFNGEPSNLYFQSAWELL